MLSKDPALTSSNALDTQRYEILEATSVDKEKVDALKQTYLEERANANNNSVISFAETQYSENVEGKEIK